MTLSPLAQAIVEINALNTDFRHKIGKVVDKDSCTNCYLRTIVEGDQTRLSIDKSEGGWWNRLIEGIQRWWNKKFYTIDPNDAQNITVQKLGSLKEKFFNVDALAFESALKELESVQVRIIPSDLTACIENLDTFIRIIGERKYGVDTAMQKTFTDCLCISPLRASKDEAYELKVDEFLDKLNLDDNVRTKTKREIIEKNTLDLNGMNLTQIPSGIGNLTKLERLEIGHNKLTTLPPEIGYLTNLQVLLVAGNKLTNLPPAIENLINLQVLGIGNTNLTTLPDWIGNLTNLRGLHSSFNNLTTLPPQIGNLTNLQHLSLASNNITTLPSEIGNLSKLRWFDLSNNSLTGIPSTVRNLQNLTVMDMEGNPILLQGENEVTLGRQELWQHFGNRVVLSNPSIATMPLGTTKEEVYGMLDEEPERINRAKFAGAKLPEIPTPSIEHGGDFLNVFAKVVSQLNFDDEKAPGYLSYELLSGDYASETLDVELDNAAKIGRAIIPRLTGYFKTLYEMPLEEGEQSGWQMYEDKIPAIKQSLSYIVSSLSKLDDPEQRASLFLQLTEGLLHCPTGQKEGIDTVTLALLENTTARSVDLAEVVERLIAMRKNAFFKNAILVKAAENSQNVHLISTYERKLKDELGLSNALEYKERMGTFGTDPFNRNENNVLRVFYELVTPGRMASWLTEKIQTQEDLRVRETLGELEKKRATSTSADPGQLLEEAYLKAKKRLESDLTQATQDSDEEWIKSIQKRSIVLEKDVLRWRELKAKQSITNQDANEIRQIEMIFGIKPTQGPSLTENERVALQSQIAQLRGKWKEVGLFRPISGQMVTQYLIDNRMVHPQTDPDWWTSYFTEDPMVEEKATVTLEGVKTLLVHLGYVISESD